MIITVTKEHFDRAVSVPWSTTTCIIAQAIQEKLGKPLRGCGATGALFARDEPDIYYESVIELQMTFDKYHSNGQGTKEEILALLPYNINVCDPTNLAQ